MRLSPAGGRCVWWRRPCGDRRLPSSTRSRSRRRRNRRAIDGAGLTPATKLRPPGLLELENLLAEQLDTRVSVQMTAKRGRVTIDFADLEDLERIYRVIAG